MKKFLLLLLLFLLIPINIIAESIDLAPNATSAIIIEASTGTVIYNKNEHEKLAPASMTKMMGLLLIMEQIEKGNLKWDEMVTASSNASSMGGSQIFLETGEQMSVEELVKGISIASGNDAMVAMAEKIAGTEEAFVELMNKKASELGLKNTNFKNCTGLDAENHYSSANDMALIAKELVKHDKILEFSGTYEDYIREGTDKSFWLVNTNKLVRFYQGVDGLKTGYTSTAGYCLTATAKRNGMRLITVVMNEPDSTTRNSETTAMLDYGFNMYGMEQLLNKDNVLGKIKVDLGEKEYVEVVPKEDINILNNKTNDKRNVSYNISLNNVKAPIKVGDIVGKINVIENNKTIMTIDVTVKEDINKANIFISYLRNLKDIVSGNI